MICGVHHIESRFCPFFVTSALLFAPDRRFPQPPNFDRVELSLVQKSVGTDRTLPVENSVKTVENSADPGEKPVENFSPD
ncbi:MAG: hypothetical protein CV045_01015 [Cyanobacteria bacterium M5B4]|nr:hypothetical protein [Cyanobacteria bacterium KgW148]PLS69605.1 MAG: hypothetical protein CV045_01015 [Cyanobacteria bacterium M5B4]